MKVFWVLCCLCTGLCLACPVDETACVFTVQVLDYGISLKTDNYLLSMECKVRLLRLMQLLAGDKSNKYLQSELMNMLIMLHQFEHKLPHGRMLKKSLSMYNEEAGEIAFSVLARCAIASTQKKRVQHMSDMFAQIHSLRATDDDLRGDLSNDHGRGNWRKNYTRDDSTVVAVRAHVEARLRSIKAGVATKYDGTPEGYLNQKAAARHQVPFNSRTVQPQDQAHTEVILDMHLEKCGKYVETSWGADRSEVWPNMAREVVDEVVEFAERQQHFVPMPAVVEGHANEKPVGKASRKKVPSQSSRRSRAVSTGAAEHGPDEAKCTVNSSGASSSREDVPSKHSVQSCPSDSSSSTCAPVDESYRLAADDPRLQQSWNEFGKVHSGNILASGAKRTRTKRVVPNHLSDWTSDSQGHRLSRKPKYHEERMKERRERADQQALRRKRKRDHNS